MEKQKEKNNNYNRMKKMLITKLEQNNKFRRKSSKTEWFFESARKYPNGEWEIKISKQSQRLGKYVSIYFVETTRIIRQNNFKNWKVFNSNTRKWENIEW